MSVPDNNQETYYKTRANIFDTISSYSSGIVIAIAPAMFLLSPIYLLVPTTAFVLSIGSYFAKNYYSEKHDNLQINISSLGSNKKSASNGLSTAPNVIRSRISDRIKEERQNNNITRDKSR